MKMKPKLRENIISIVLSSTMIEDRHEACKPK